MTETTQVPAPATGRPVVYLGELQRAWEAVQAGRFRSTARPKTAGHTAAPVSACEWFPAETVIPVIGAGGGVGATTLALALATTSTAPARVVECVLLGHGQRSRRGQHHRARRRRHRLAPRATRGLPPPDLPRARSH